MRKMYLLIQPRIKGGELLFVIIACCLWYFYNYSVKKFFLKL
jgi:hypothetical protein